jgi:hypothetical protein
VFGEDALAERLALHERHGFNPAQPASGEAEAADTAEGVDHAEGCHHRPPAKLATNSSAGAALVLPSAAASRS